MQITEWTFQEKKLLVNRILDQSAENWLFFLQVESDSPVSNGMCMTPNYVISALELSSSFMPWIREFILLYDA